MINSSETTEKGLVTLSDADLLDAWIRDSEQAAFAVLVHRYTVMVLSVCRRRCRSTTDADDAYQTTFLYLASNAGKIRRPECLPGWLHRVAQRASVATFTANSTEPIAMVDLPAKPDDPFDRLTQRHEAIVLDEELAALPDHYRTALVMHVFEDEPLASLAERFGTTLGSIRGRLQRGKRLLAQRLRKRGIVPVLAFAAANAWTVPEAIAAKAGSGLVDATAGGEPPQPPIDSSLLDSLLSNGNQTMNAIFGAGSLAAGAAVILMMCVGDPADTGNPGVTDGTTTAQVITLEETETQDEKTVQPTIVQSDDSFVHMQMVQTPMPQPAKKVAANKKGRNKKKGKNKDSGENVAQNLAGGLGGGGFDGQFVAPNTMTITKAVAVEPDSVVAAKANDALDAEMEFDFTSDLASLPNNLAGQIGVPVFVDDRAVTFAKVDPKTASFSISSGSIPVRTALRSLLKPHGLKATVENEGIVITADHQALVQRDIGTARWVTIDDDFEKNVSAKLQSTADYEWVEVPLQEVVSEISRQAGLPIRIDERALEDDGLTLDEPVTATLSGVTLNSVLNIVSRQLDLTFVLRDESVVITSVADEESSQISRIYWLESTGFGTGDFNPWMDVIQTSFTPDTWEQLGGASTISPMASSRPALLITTTYRIHKDIERFMKSLRDSHHGPDPVAESVEVPAPTISGGGLGGGGGGMGGGGFF